MKNKSWFILALLACGSAQAAVQYQENTKHFPHFELPVDVLYQRKYNVLLELNSPARLGKGFGMTLGATRQWDILATDFRLHYEAFQFGSFFVPATFSTLQSNTPDGITDPNSEYNRPRSADDAWTILIFEPGVSVTGRIFPDKMPLWSQSARVGVGYAKFQDKVNAVGFTGYIFSTEASVIYNFSHASRYSLATGLGYDWGWIHATQPLNPSSTATTLNAARRLPVYWLQLNVGLHYAF